VPRPRDEHPVVLLMTRFAVPALILVFYATAAMRFEYTPESTFATLVALDGAPVTSLWSALLAVASLLRLDTWLTAKIFSMVFCCFALLFTYLVAHEVLGDRLLALCAVLALSMQAWLVQLAPSGSGVSFALVLSLAAMFFLLRNDYLVASVAAGLTTLVSWQGIMLLPTLLFDAYINSIQKGRSIKVALSIMLVYGGVLLPWVLYAVYAGAPLLPDEIGLSDVPTILPHLSFEMVFLVGVMFVGVAVLALRERQLLRIHTAPVLWIAVASFTHHVMFTVTLPLIIVYALFSTQHIIWSLRRSPLAQIGGILLTALLLAYNQFVALPVTTSLIEEASATTAGLKSAALWLRTHTPEDAAINVPSGHNRLIEFYAARRIGNVDARFLITADRQVSGFEVVFDPLEENPTLLAGAIPYKVWKRK
jgi:hypothetical protein